MSLRDRIDDIDREDVVDAAQKAAAIYRIPIVGSTVRKLGDAIKRQLQRGRARRVARREKRRAGR